MTEIGGSDGEAIPAPDVGGAGGSRAQQGGNAGSAIIASRFCCESRSAGSRFGLNFKREQQLDSLCLIGQGSAALVYLVRCRSTGRLSALKVQRKTDHARSVERVQMEREVMVDARHPLVTPLYAAFQDRLYLYLDMEYCPGGSLDNFVRYCVKRNLTEDEARFYAAEITLGLEFLHSKGYVYRDLKAANVLVAASGHIKLTDFGIAERGKVKVETEYKAVSPPPPLSRTQSSPVFSEVPLVPGTTATGHQRRQTHPEEAPRSQKQGSSCAPTTRIRVTKKASGGYPTLFHWRQQNTSSEVTTPHLAGLGARICDRFTRARGLASTRSPSGSKLSGLEGSAATPSPRIQRKTPDTREGMGAPVPFFRGYEYPREGEWKQGLPPSDPGVVPLDRSGNPYSNGLLPVARQTSVALAESSWGVLSGSPEYMAPEVLMHDSQGSAVDWWGMGILTYELLFGRTPFAGERGKTRLTYLNIMNKEVQFPEGGRREEGEVSGVCKDFVQALLTKDPRGRAGSRGAHAVKAHPFFRGVSWDHLLKQEAPLVPRLLGTRCCVRPPPVENTSGWWWDVEDGIVDVEEEHRSRQGKQEDVWSLFGEFNWVNEEAVRGRSMELQERCGACGKQGNVPLGSDGVGATTAASRA